MAIKLERKRFYYFRVDGGEFEFVPGGDQPNMIAWMHPECVERDMEMVKWCATAEVGTMFEHRIGTVVRLKNHEPEGGQ